MTLTHYIGGKIAGDSTDFATLSTNYPNLSTFIDFESLIEYILIDDVWTKIGTPPPAQLGGWKEIGRTTLVSPNTEILIPENFPTLPNLPDKRYYMVLTNIVGESASADVGVRFNELATSIYARRFSTNGATDITTGNLANAMWHPTDVAGTLPIFGVHYISNLSAQEKVFLGHTTRSNTLGSAGTPARAEVTGKQVLTTDPIKSITLLTGTAATFNLNSEVVVLGWDPNDPETGGFWEELSDTNLLGGEADIIQSNLFTPKKYLWVQVFLESSGTIQDGLRLGNNSIDDATDRYAYRFKVNGGQPDTLVPNQTKIGDFNNLNANAFANFYIINNADQEKLVIGHTVYPTAIGNSAPNRTEWVGKWVESSLQANLIQMFNVAGAGSYGVNTRMKVWGSD